MLCKRRGIALDGVIDVNPAKHGKYLPATGMPVMSHEHALEYYPEGTHVYVMNSNYLDEIKAMSKNRFHYIGVDQ